MESKKYTPCGGCGAETPIDRCIGCFHPFDAQPSPVCESDFIEFVKNERNEISKEMLSDEWWLEIPAAKRVKFENVLIAYDQMVERLNKSQPAAGREEDAVALLRWLNENSWKPNDDGTWHNFISGFYSYTPEKVTELFQSTKGEVI